MQPNAFIGRKDPPTDADLSETLGKASELWVQLLADLKPFVPDQEWSSYSLKAGWALKLKKNGRNILYLSPRKGCFLASFALGEKAIKAAKESGLSKSALKIIAESRKYAEGTAVRVEIKSPRDFALVVQLAQIKLAH